MYPFSRVALAITPSPTRRDVCLSPEKAQHILEYLLKHGCITPDAEIHLQHDADPLEHPELSAILRVLGSMDFGYHITTKADLLPSLEKDLQLSHMRSLIFTMDAYCNLASDKDSCGSLAAMHDHMLAVLHSFRAHGFRGRCAIVFPAYPMEEERDEAVCAFAFTSGMAVLRPVTPCISVEDTCTALKHTPLTEQTHAGNALLPPVWRLMQKTVAQMPSRPQNFQCTFSQELAISATGQLTPCSKTLAPEHTLGDICTMTLEDMHSLRTHSKACLSCRACGADWALSAEQQTTLPPRINGMPERIPCLTPGGRWVWMEDNPFGYKVRQDSCAPRLRHFCRAHVRPGHIGLDIGAKSGYYTTLFARLVGSEGKIYAFEPNARFQRILEHTLHNNGVHNTLIMPFGVGGIPLYGTAQATQADKARPLDAMTNRLVLPKLDFMRIDAGQNSLCILAGAIQLIERYNPLIMLAFEPDAWSQANISPQQFQAWLKKHNLHCFTTTGQRIPDADFIPLCTDAARGSHLLLQRDALFATDLCNTL